MRSRIIEYLNGVFHTGAFAYVIPDPAFVYTAMLAIGAWMFVRRCRGISISPYHAAGMALWASVGGLIGARAFYLLQHIDDVIQNPAILVELNGATVSFGVYIGGTLGALLYFAFQRSLPALEYLDTAASVLGIGPMVGRIACFLNGDDFGTITSLPWGVRFPHGSYPFIAQVDKGLISPMDDLSLPVHPVQLYSSLVGLAFLVLFTFLWRKRLFKPGVLFLLFWMGYSVGRFFLEFFRGDEDRGWVGSLSTGQFMSIVFFSLAALFMLALHWWRTKVTPSESQNTSVPQRMVEPAKEVRRGPVREFTRLHE